MSQLISLASPYWLCPNPLPPPPPTYPSLSLPPPSENASKHQSNTKYKKNQPQQPHISEITRTQSIGLEVQSINQLRQNAPLPGRGEETVEIKLGFTKASIPPASDNLQYKDAKAEDVNRAESAFPNLIICCKSIRCIKNHLKIKQGKVKIIFNTCVVLIKPLIPCWARRRVFPDPERNITGLTAFPNSGMPLPPCLVPPKTTTANNS
uniref:Uncharacterized protein n=1 Tax=Oryza meridionalis TaxID=40149 RepID=A0A0E0C8L9_9ORYZ